MVYMKKQKVKIGRFAWGLELRFGEQLAKRCLVCWLGWSYGLENNWQNVAWYVE
jgi:hypothetical protein